MFLSFFAFAAQQSSPERMPPSFVPCSKYYEAAHGVAGEVEAAAAAGRGDVRALLTCGSGQARQLLPCNLSVNRHKVGNMC
jgi:hypothetical protein